MAPYTERDKKVRNRLTAGISVTCLAMIGGIIYDGISATTEPIRAPRGTELVISGDEAYTFTTDSLQSADAIDCGSKEHPFLWDQPNTKSYIGEVAGKHIVVCGFNDQYPKHPAVEYQPPQ